MGGQHLIFSLKMYIKDVVAHESCNPAGLNADDSLTWQMQTIIPASSSTYFSDLGWKTRAWWRFLCWRRLEWCGSASRKSYRSQTGDLECKWGNQTKRKKHKADHPFFFFEHIASTCTTCSALLREKLTSCKLWLVAAEKQTQMLKSVNLSIFTGNYRIHGNIYSYYNWKLNKFSEFMYNSDDLV